MTVTVDRANITMDEVLLAKRMLSSGALPKEVSGPHVDVLARAFKQQADIRIASTAGGFIMEGLSSTANIPWQDCAMSALVKILQGADRDTKTRAMPLVHAARGGMNFHASRARINKELIKGLMR